MVQSSPCRFSASATSIACASRSIVGRPPGTSPCTNSLIHLLVTLKFGLSDCSANTRNLSMHVPSRSTASLTHQLNRSALSQLHEIRKRRVARHSHNFPETLRVMLVRLAEKLSPDEPVASMCAHPSAQKAANMKRENRWPTRRTP